jgi:hypothetical protein
MDEMTPPIDVSICMVSLNCWHVLENCLNSLPESLRPYSYEVIIVDNASTDGTLRELERRGFPHVRWVRNNRNLGFTKATNQGIRQSSGRHILWLNTDTVLEPGSLRRMCAFLDSAPKAGIVGPKVLNADGSFQAQCRRGMPTPWASLAYFLKLERFFGRSSEAGQYLLRHLPVDEANRVDSVSGCCLMARREVWESIGPLDEAIFGFGEDIDWCVRAQNAGWEVWYLPESVIIHLRGQGGVHAKPYHKVWGIHQAMWVFFNKHQKPKHSWIFGLCVKCGILASLAFSLVSEGCRQAIRRLFQGAA